jgi:hypothetical protein
MTSPRKPFWSSDRITPGAGGTDHGIHGGRIHVAGNRTAGREHKGGARAGLGELMRDGPGDLDRVAAEQQLLGIEIAQ